MVIYLEKMIPHADWSFLGLGNGFGVRAKGKGRALEGEKKNMWLVF